MAECSQRSNSSIACTGESASSYDRRFGATAKTTIASILKRKDEVDADLPLVPKKRASISFGFASASTRAYRKPINAKYPDEDANTVAESNFYEDEKSIRGTFLIPGDNNTMTPMNCEGLSGPRAEKYLQNLPVKHFERIRKYVETNDPKETENFLWIRNDSTSKVTVLNMQNLRKCIKTMSSAKHVKWRHISLDKISVYRYSVPSVSTDNYRIRVISCIHRNKRFFLLFLWILIVSLTLIVVFCTIYSSYFNGTHAKGHYNTSRNY